MKRLFLPFMALFLLIGGTMRAQQELTVYDGTASSSNIPAYISYFDDFAKSQVVIPAADLSEMSGGTISSMKFYVNSSTSDANIPYTTASTVDVYLMEVDYTSISAYEPKENGTIVYNGTLDVVSGAKDDKGSLTINFSTPYSYNGGNLLIGIENTNDLGYKFIYFTGTQVEGASIAGSNGSATGTIPATQRNFIPKTTFTYTEGGDNPDDPEPQDIPNEFFYISASGWAMWQGAPNSYPGDNPDECVIDIINVTGFEVPTMGTSPSTVVAAGDNYTVTDIEWYESTSMDPMAADDVFEMGHTYYLIFNVIPDDGCTFADNCQISINGETALVDLTYSTITADAITVATIDFDVTEGGTDDCVIDYVNIDGFVEPVFGEAATTAGLTSNDDSYEVTYATWADASGNEVTDGTIFGAGLYFLYVELTPSANCTVDEDNLTFAFNDDETLADAQYSGYDTDNEVLYTYTIDYTLTAPPTPSIIFPITFEDGTLGGLTAIDNDNDGNAFVAYNASSQSHGGNYHARVKYNESGCDDYLIIPVTPTNGDVLRFYAASYSSGYLESFDVRVSTTTPTVDAFTTVLGSYTNVPYYSNGYTEYTFDLSTYAGQSIYVAIHCNSVDKFYFLVDDIDIVSAKKAATVKKGFLGMSVKAIAHNSNKVMAFDRNRKAAGIAPASRAMNAWGAKGNRDITWNFDDSSMGDWTTIDADGDTYTWVLGSQVGGVYLVADATLAGSGHNASADMIVSGSYSNVAGVLTPDNYLVSPQLSITESSNTFKFWACGQDGTYAAEHFGVAVSTTSNTDPSAFTMIQEWDMTAKNAANNGTKPKMRGQNRAQGNWYEYMVDLSQYVGQDVYVAIRHFNCSDQFMLDVDDIALTSVDLLVGYNLYLDGNLVAEGITDTDYYMQEAEDFADGSEHTATIEAVYTSGAILEGGTKAWTFQSGDHFTGATDGLTVDAVGTTANLSWELPSAGIITTDFSHDFANGQGEFTFLDANGDGNTWAIISGTASMHWADANDDYLIFPQMTMTEESALALATACNGTSFPETFEVCVSTTGTAAADFTAIATETVGTTTPTTYTYDLSQYAGQAVYLAIHNISADMYYQFIPAVEVTNVMMEANHIGAVVYRDNEIIAKLRNGEESYTDQFTGDVPSYCIRIIQNGDMEGGVYYALAEKQCVENVQPQECEAPYDLAATVDVDDATLTWAFGDGEVGESYTYDFEDGLNGWTTFEGADAETTWIHSDNNLGGYDYTTHAHSGTGFAMSYSFVDNDGAYQADNYLVSPVKYAITDGMMMSFFYDFANDNYPDNFSVEVSTAGNDAAADFTSIWTPSAKSVDGNKANVRRNATRYDNWRQVTIDLSQYAGQEIWIAFHHNDYDAYEVWIDDVAVGDASALLTTFNIYRSEDGETYEVIAENVSGNTYTDEDLELGTYYYQVTANNTVAGIVCESEPAMAADSEDDFVVVEIEEVEPETCLAPFDLAATSEGNDVTLTWDYEVEEGEASVEYNFDDSSLSGWTTIDGDGDGYNWVLGSQCGGVYLATGNSLAGAGHNSSADLVVSGSYSNVAGVLTPDNYLVSPQITVDATNSMFSFWACGQDAGYVAEHFGVAVSTTSNTDASAFTTIQEWTMTAKGTAAKVVAGKKQRGEGKAQGSWHQYTVDLSEYMGQDIYVAIRHFNCSDYFMLDVDDIAFSGAVEINATFTVYRSTDGETYEIIAENVNEMTYTDEDLDYGTYYYQVTASSVLSDGTDCESDPALDVNEENDYVMVELIEPTYECIAAINLDATVDGGSAILTWEMPTGESYEYDFEGGLNGWTTFEGADAETTWIHSDNNLGGYDYTTHAHSGTGFAMSYSFVDNVSAYQADNYLVSPVKYSIENGTTMTFFYDFANESYADFFAVEVSTGSNNTAADFTEVWSTDGKKANGGNAIVRKVNGTRYDNWQEATIDLSAFAGQEVWIAFHHEDYDMYEVWIDDVTVGAGASAPLFNIYRSTDGENYELIAEGVEEMNYTDTGLSDGTYYYQVTSVLYDYDGEVACESDPALAVNGEDDFVMVTIDGIEDFSSLINVYPNPTKANVNIEAEGLSNIVVFNALGQVVYEVNATDDHVVVNMSNFGAGVYMFNIVTSNGTTVKRVTVAK